MNQQSEFEDFDLFGENSAVIFYVCEEENIVSKWIQTGAIFDQQPLCACILLAVIFFLCHTKLSIYSVLFEQKLI